jgi:type IV secretion system protein TrbL
MKYLRSCFLLCFLAFVHSAAFAAVDDVTIVNTVNKAMGSVAAQSIMPQAILWLSSLVGLQFIITNFALIKSGADIENVFGKLIGSLAWFSFCFYMLTNGPDFLDSVGTGIMNKFFKDVPSPGSIIASTLGLCATLLTAIGVTGTSVVGTGNSAIANVLVACMFIIFSIGMYMAIKIMMISLELGLVVMLSPLSFSFLGLNALKDQGIAPLKSLISLVYRTILLGVICSAFKEVSDTASTQLLAVTWGDPLTWGKGLKSIMSMLCAYPVIAYLAYKSDSIASSLASGSTSMGPGDVASAAAAGAAAGAAIGAGSTSVVGAAAKGPQAMGDVIKGMMSGGSVANASSRGAGGQSPAGDAPRRGASLSTQGAGQGAGAASAGSGSPSAGGSSGTSAGTATQGVGGTSRALQDSGGAPVRSSPGADGLAAGSPSQEGKSPDQSVSQDLTMTPAAEATAGAGSANPMAQLGGTSTRPSVSALGAAPVRPAPAAGSSAPGATANSRPGGAKSGSPQGSPASSGAAESVGGADSSAPLSAGDAPVRSSNGNVEGATNSASPGTPGAQASSGAQNGTGSSSSSGEAPARSAAPVADKSDARSLGDGSSAGLDNPAAGTTQTPKADSKTRSRREHLDELTRQLSQEKSATSVSISTHNSD